MNVIFIFLIPLALVVNDIYLKMKAFVCSDILKETVEVERGQVGFSENQYSLKLALWS